MSSTKFIPSKQLMAERLGSINPAKYPEEEFELYSIPAFDAGMPEYVKGAEIGSTKQIVQTGDVLLSKIVPHIRRSWIVGPNKGKRIIASGEWIVFRNSEVVPQYLRHVLVGDAFHAQFMNTVSGVGGSLMRARPAFVAKIDIPLPPREEQKRIADILDRADEIRAKRRQTIELVSSLTQSIFIEMFGDPVTNPFGWDDNSRLDQICDVTSGITKGRNVKGNPTREVPYMAVLNVQDKRLNLTTIKTIEATEEEISKYKLLENDLLLTEGGDPDKLGRGSLWKNELPEAIHQNHIFKVRIKDQDKISPVFLNWLIGSQRGKNYFLKAAKQTTGIATINSSQLKSFPMLLPPKKLQDEFAKRAEEVAQLKLKLDTYSDLLNTTFASIQQQAFSGEL